MPIANGTRLGPYEIAALLGAGGMGEVYRATDTRLNRTVAIKILSSQVSATPEMRQRFDREAQTIAGLTHPNICTLHDVGHQDGLDYLVMECLEGETLATRLERGALPVADAVRIASEIGDALDRAHRQGIVHRDLKPGNIMLTKTGAKLLDFGLAKLRGGDAAAAMPVAVSALPTNANALTVAGTMLGTLQYMAPEQLEGREADARTDIFAFGATLYEMLTGQRAFQGKTQVSLMAAILEHDPPPMSTLQPILPAALDAVVQGCLAKDPDERWQSIRDVVRQLKRIETAPVERQGAPATADRSRVSRRERIVWGSLVAAMLIGGATAWTLAARRPIPTPAVVRFEISLPPSALFTSAQAPRFAVSPDGRSVALVVAVGGKEQLWIRRLDSPDAVPIPGTESRDGEFQVQSPFWSPDSRFVGFVVQTVQRGAAGTSRFKKVDVQGGQVQELCELPSNNGYGSWGADGTILVSSAESKGIKRISSNGGVPVPVTTIDNASGESAHAFPQFLPDGKHFLYQAQSAARGKWATHVGSLDGAQSALLVQSEYARFVSPDWVLFTRGSTVLAQHVDEKTFALKGEAEQVAESVAINSGNGRAAFSASDNGVLVISSVSSDLLQGNSQLFWIDRSGRLGPPLGKPFNGGNLRLSPDGRYVAMPQGTPPAAPDLWVYDLEREAPRRVTTHPSADRAPVWLSNERFVYSSERDVTPALYEAQVAGAVPERQFLPAEGQVGLFALDVSRDGRFLLFGKNKAGSRDIWTLDLPGATNPRPYIATEFDEVQAAFAPDGQRVAYVTSQSGEYEVVAQSFPEPSNGIWPVSVGGGWCPRWKGDGRELYYIDPEGWLVAVPVSAGSPTPFGKPVRLFDSGIVLRANLTPACPYDVPVNGTRFLLAKQVSSVTAAPLTVTLNWNALLK